MPPPLQPPVGSHIHPQLTSQRGFIFSSVLFELVRPAFMVAVVWMSTSLLSPKSATCREEWGGHNIGRAYWQKEQALDCSTFYLQGQGMHKSCSFSSLTSMVSTHLDLPVVADQLQDKA
jgi:hypothetical protein